MVESQHFQHCLPFGRDVDLQLHLHKFLSSFEAGCQHHPAFCPEKIPIVLLETPDPTTPRSLMLQFPQKHSQGSLPQLLLCRSVQGSGADAGWDLCWQSSVCSAWSRSGRGGKNPSPEELQPTLAQAVGGMFGLGSSAPFHRQGQPDRGVPWKIFCFRVKIKLKSEN